MINSDLNSLSERKSVIMATVLAILPGIITITLFYDVIGVSNLPGFLYGGLGMLYVERWLYASLGFLIIDLLCFILMTLLGLAVLIKMWIVLLLVYQFVVLPIWAAKTAIQYNKLALSLEQETNR